MVRQAGLIGVIVVLANGQVQVVSEQHALGHLDEKAFVQALGIPKYALPPNYREITQARQCNTVVDNAREQIQLGR